jgi:ABC-2 type transport system permease protein
MSVVGAIARDELRHLARNRVALTGALMLALLSLVAAITSFAQANATAELRARYQAEADERFKGQPDRHPHRVVHYGHFVFRPLGPLAAFDPGVDPFTGNAMFLEGHRQNSANFGDVRQSSLLVRFGQLTPAFVLQTLAPLVLIFLGYGIVARERERGTLRQMLAQGVAGRQLVLGKALGLAAVAGVLAVPALLTLLVIAATPGMAAPVGAIGAGYLLYLLVWTLAIVIVSSIVPRARDALIALVALWALTVVLLPRVMPDFAVAAYPIPTRLETDIAIARDLRASGDSHNPDDPFFAAFKQRTLKQYGVTRVEDLPVNYRGLVAVEGEKLTSSLFDRYADRSFARQQTQSGIVDAAGALSPAILIRRLSMAAAGTDLAGHQRFLEQAEAYRYAIVQRLNQLQTDAVSAADDGAKSSDTAAERRSRVSAANFAAMPSFTFRAVEPATLARSALGGIGALALWVLVLGGGVVLASRRVAGARA